MEDAEKTIPYCGRCNRKEKRDSLKSNEYYCDVVSCTPMKGIVTEDTDGTDCVTKGYYKTTKE